MCGEFIAHAHNIIETSSIATVIDCISQKRNSVLLNSNNVQDNLFASVHFYFYIKSW